MARRRPVRPAGAEDDAPLSLALGIHASWKSLQEAGHIPGDIKLDDFLNVDANVAVHEELTEGDVFKSVRELVKPSDGDDDSAHNTPASVASPLLGTPADVIAMALLRERESHV